MSTSRKSSENLRNVNCSKMALYKAYSDIGAVVYMKGYESVKGKFPSRKFQLQ